MKVIGIGLNKTGTSSLGYILRELGYNTREHFLQLTYDYRSSDSKVIIDEAKKYDAIYGMPWSLVFKELDKAFPKSKFILTTRKEPETYYNSHLYHLVRPVSFKRRNITAEALMVEHGCNPLFNKDRFINIYKNHNDSVREYFKDRKEDMLEICWETGSTIKDVCKFLDKDILNITLPHLKKASYDNYERYERIAKKNPKRYLGVSKEEASKIIEW